MQLIDRAKLEMLAKMPDVVTEEEHSFSFSDFVAEWKRTMDEMKKYVKERDEILEQTYKELKNGWLKQHKKAFAYIGEGSSRAAFAFPGGKCLKIAMNSAGIAQNKQEYKNIGKSKYQCFVQVHEFDKTTGCAMLTECCSVVTSSDFKKAFNMQQTEFAKDVETMFQNQNSNRYNSLDQMLKFFKNAYDRVVRQNNRYYKRVYSTIMMMIENALKSKLPQWNIVTKDLMQFYIDNGGDELLAGDLGDLQNWGLAIRQGAIVPVIIDAGFSETVYQKYY